MSVTALLWIFGLLVFAAIGLIGWTALYLGAIVWHVWRLK